MKIKPLAESYFNTAELKNIYTGQKKTAEVFINPTSKEMDEVSQTVYGKKYIRFIANSKTKEIYAFPPEVMHAVINKKLNLKSSEYFSIWGVAEKNGSKWTAISFDQAAFEEKVKNSIIKKNWDWVNKFIDINTLIAELKEYWYKTNEKYYPREFSGAKSKAIKLKEEYVASQKSDYGYFEIFKNPTQKEMLESSETVYGKKYIRFIIDTKEKTLFVFSPLMFHMHASKKIGLGEFSRPFENVWGVAVKTPKGWEIDSSDEGVHIKLNKLDFIKKYKLYFGDKIMKKIDEFRRTGDMNLNPELISKKLKEEYVGDSKKNGINFPVFLNPSSTEYKEVQEKLNGKFYVRFIAMPKEKKLYIFSPEQFHIEVAKYLNIELTGRNNFWGVAKKTASGWKVVSSDVHWDLVKEKNFINSIKWLEDEKNFDFSDFEDVVKNHEEKLWKISNSKLPSKFTKEKELIKQKIKGK